jgi:hypothetical protein
VISEDDPVALTRGSAETLRTPRAESDELTSLQPAKTPNQIEATLEPSLKPIVKPGATATRSCYLENDGSREAKPDKGHRPSAASP